MDNVDRKGTFIGTVIESTVGMTKESGLPRWVARLETTKYWASSTEELTHYGIAEPAYVDYVGQEIIAYLCLFGKDGQPMFNYEQVQLATKWDGQSFDTLADAAGKSIMFRTEAKKAYINAAGATVDNGGFEVVWVDDVAAPAERELKKLDATALSGLNAKFLAGIKKAAPPKPAVTAAKPLPPKQPAVAAPATTTAPATVAAVVAPVAPVVAATPAATTAKPKKTTKPPVSKPPVVEAPASLPISGLPSEQEQMAAWEYVNTVKGAADDSEISTAWVTACNVIGGGKQEQEFTNANWAAIRDHVIATLGLGVNQAA